MPSYPPVESVVRTLALLEALNREPIATIAKLHARTQIPKPSIVRLLRTLESQGYVKHGAVAGSYLLTSKVRALASGYHSEPRIVEAVAPLLDALTEEVRWPSALAVPEGGSIVVLYSTIPASPLSLLHSSINMKLSLVSRALGRAYLAFCDADEREVLIKLAAASDEAEDRGARDLRTLTDTLELVRRQGYALRDVTVRPVSRTLAVPVFDARRAVAAIGITWFASTMKSEEAVERYLEPLLLVAAKARAALAARETAVDATATVTRTD
ncbi:DNA-binding transcriptional regulator [soil metagenome]